MESKRFYHGINLFKILNLLDKIKEKKILIEINPISNQSLRNIRDLRMHPAISYLNYGICISINNDDPFFIILKVLIMIFLNCC